MPPAHCPTCDCEGRTDRPARRGVRRPAQERHGSGLARRDDAHRMPAPHTGDRRPLPPCTIIPLRPSVDLPPTSLWREMMERWLPGGDVA